MKRSRQRFNPRIYHPFNGDKMLDTTKCNKDRMTNLFNQIKSIEKANRQEKECKETVQPEVTESNVQKEVYDVDSDLKNVLNPEKIISFNVVETKNESKVEEMNTIPQINLSDEEEEPMYHIANNQRLSSILDYEDTIIRLIDMVEHAEDQYQYCMSKISEADREVQDFLHEVRAPKKNAYEGFKLYQIGHKIEIRRQAYKEGVKLLKPYVAYAKKLKEDIKQLKHIVEYTDNFKSSMENSIYMPRSNLKLPVGDKFRALTKEEQDIIRQNYKKKKKMS